MEKVVLLNLIKAYIKKMPSLSTTVSRILDICNDPNASPADLNQVISLDPVLMGRVMRLINSAYYSLPNKITSLVRAIIMLGINTVKNLALSTAVLASLNNEDNFQALDMDGFWRHSLCVGVTSKIIARKRKIDPKILEEYFISGLLHDLGKIPLNNRLSEEYFEAISFSGSEHCPLYVSEGRMLEVTHSEVGKLIIEAWNLSKDIEDTVNYHHRLKEYKGEYHDILYTVASANLFANTYEIGFSGDRYPEQLPAEVASFLGIAWEFFDSIESTVNREIEKAQVFLALSKKSEA